MKRLFHLMIAALASAALFSGCQKYDDTEIRQELKELGDRVTALETWCRSSQEAIDNVAKLKEAVEGMKSVKSVDAFDEDGATGYVITFTDGQSIKLYNGKDGNDGDTFFGKVEIDTECVIFTLADGSSFTVRRVKPATIGFDSYETKTIARGDTLWTVMERSFTKANFAAFTAELMTEDGTATAIATKSAAADASWKIEAVAPEFDTDGKFVRPAGIVVAKAPQTGGKGVLKVAIIDNEGSEETSSVVVDVEPNYLSFMAVEPGATVSMEIEGELVAPKLEYSTDLKVWTDFDFSYPQTITLANVGDKVYWRNKDKTETFSSADNVYVENHVHFNLGKKKIASQGNIMSLLDKKCAMTQMPRNATFMGLFYDNPTLISAPEMPATKLSESCYYYMFSGCESLEKAPELPATDLPRDCYGYMFESCSSLTDVPDIPATKVGSGSCFSMFMNCTSLVKAPALPAKQLGAFCYQQMFYKCSALEQAPELPATELAVYCYGTMLSNCTSLKEAPELPALKMEESCYYAMFWGCKSLETAPELPASELAEYCYRGMFVNCLSLKNAPVLPATHLAESCYFQMFAGCESLEKAPELPAEELSYACYYSMFWGCNSLLEAPVLPATKLAKECYGEMFGFSGLKKAPELPATKLVTYCYDYMFEDCKSLEEGPYLPAMQLYPGCYEGMFENCANLRYLKVSFVDWGDGSATAGWAAGVPAGGQFECPGGLEVKYGEGYIPAGWSVNGAAPAATKSLTAPAAGFISGRHRKSQALTTPEIMDRPVKHGMLTL